jgi:hypothetical protein
MSTHSLIRFAAVTLLALSIAACSDSQPAPTQAELPDLRRDRLPDDVVQKLETLRNSLRQYESFELAKASGFDIQVTPCMVMRPHGGMGFHYGNGQLIDGTPDETAPEVLLYEPVKPSGMRLVGVEFIVPFDQWTSSTPPVLFGRQMSRNETFQVWALHAWLFKRNPQGVFADWNPTVNC